MKTRALGFVMATLAAFGAAQGPFQATGIKIGEVTDRSAIVWTRLTRHAQRNPDAAKTVAVRQEGPRGQKKVVVEYPEGITVDGIAGAVPGAPGEVQVRYRAHGEDEWQHTAWWAVRHDADFTRQLVLEGLQPDTAYELAALGRAAVGAPVASTVAGSVRTAPLPDQPARVVFTVSTGQMYDDRDGPHGYDLYGAMLGLAPHFFVHTGDVVYYDKLAKTVELAHYHWQRTYGLPSNVAFHRQVASYFIRDDHDTWCDDCWPTMRNARMHELTFAAGLRLFGEQLPVSTPSYRRFRWGRDLEVWLVEGREFRSANNAPDGPDKTIWGAEQKAWLKRTVEASDATFRVLISATPIVGPDRENKRDNHSNAGFTHEGDEVRKFLAAQKNMVVVCGDRHWQYMSVHPGTGLREYSCGPASNAHAGGWQQSDFVPEYHRFLKVAGGFLSVTVERDAGVPAMTLRFHDTAGKVRHEDRNEG